MTREYYNSLDIHVLRIRGREIGVKAPTMLKKADLIREILLVENGIVVPAKIEKGKKGRPPKECNLSLQVVESELSEEALQRCAIENIPLKEEVTPNNEEPEPPKETGMPYPAEPVQSVERNYNQMYYQPQYDPRRNDFLLQKIKEIKDIMEDIADYLIYEGL